MSNQSMLAAVRAATPSDPFPGAPVPVAADPFPGAPRTGVGLVTSSYPGDSLLPSTPNRIAGASSGTVVVDAGRDTVGDGGIQVHHQTLVFGREPEASGYGPESLAVLEGMEPVRPRPGDRIVGTGADRRSASVTAASSVCGLFGDVDGDHDDGMMRMSGGMGA